MSASNPGRRRALGTLRSLGLAGFAFVLTSGTSQNWTKVTFSKGISVYRKDTGGKIPALRGVMLVDVTPLEVAAVLQDVGKHAEWMEGCEQARVLEQVSPTERYIYVLTNVLWPGQDRDVVLHSRLTVEDAGRRVTIRARASSHPDAPAQRRKIVRIVHLDSAYRLDAVKGGTRVTYEFHSDPGGAVPDWAVGGGAKKVPIKTLSALRRRLATTRGQYATWVAGRGG